MTIMDIVTQESYTIEEFETVTDWSFEYTGSPLALDEHFTVFTIDDDPYRPMFMIMYYVIAIGVLLCCILAHIYIYQRRRHDKTSYVFPRRMDNSYEEARLTGIRPIRDPKGSSNDSDKVESARMQSSNNAIVQIPSISRAPPIVERSASVPANGRLSTVYESIDDVIPKTSKRTRASSEHCINTVQVKAKIPTPKIREVQENVFATLSSREQTNVNMCAPGFAARVCRPDVHNEKNSSDKNYSRKASATKSLTCPQQSSDMCELYETIGTLKKVKRRDSEPVRRQEVSFRQNDFKTNPQSSALNMLKDLTPTNRENPSIKTTPRVLAPPAKSEENLKQPLRRSISDQERLRQSYYFNNNEHINQRTAGGFDLGNLPDILCESLTQNPAGARCNTYNSIRLEPEAVHFEGKQEGVYDTLNHGFSFRGTPYNREMSAKVLKPESDISRNISHEPDKDTTANRCSPVHPRYQINQVSGDRSMSIPNQTSPIYLTLEPTCNNLNPSREHDEPIGSRAYTRSNSLPCSTPHSNSEHDDKRPSTSRNRRKWHKFQYRRHDSRQVNQRRSSVFALSGLYDTLM